MKSRVLHFMRAKSVEEEALPSYKRYSLPATKSNGFLSLKSQFEHLPEDPEQAKGDEVSFREFNVGLGKLNFNFSRISDVLKELMEASR